MNYTQYYDNIILNRYQLIYLPIKKQPFEDYQIDYELLLLHR